MKRFLIRLAPVLTGATLFLLYSRDLAARLKPFRELPVSQLPAGLSIEVVCYLWLASLYYLAVLSRSQD